MEHIFDLNNGPFQSISKGHKGYNSIYVSIPKVVDGAVSSDSKPLLYFNSVTDA